MMSHLFLVGDCEEKLVATKSTLAALRSTFAERQRNVAMKPTYAGKAGTSHKLRTALSSALSAETSGKVTQQGNRKISQDLFPKKPLSNGEVYPTNHLGGRPVRKAYNRLR